MQFYFIMVEPATGGNIGAAARAMKTMGFEKMRLINPCEYLEGEAQWLAHGSQDILENAELFSDFESAIADMDLVIGTTAKQRSAYHDVYGLDELNNEIVKKGSAIEKVAIVFGREDTGMRNNELKLCNLISSVPLQTVYPSLNLAQAVMLYAWELGKLKNTVSREAEQQDMASLKALNQKVEKALVSIGFKKDSNIFPRIMERVNAMQTDDMNLTHSVCNKIEKLDL